MPQDHEEFMRVALEEAVKARTEGNLGVGSVLVCDGRIVGKGRGLAQTSGDPTAHAEVAAMREARVALGRSDLAGCTLYTTYEPCVMCCGVAMLHRVSTLVLGARLHPYGTRPTTNWGSYTVERLMKLASWEDKMAVVTGVLEEQCRRTLRSTPVT
ncbi:MAG: nucleoside deaminase [Chloroflexi bacterium]|nr:nucleoside deaminase [Chloroflexota bacterium]